jgi:hypothetical protein
VLQFGEVEVVVRMITIKKGGGDDREEVVAAE